MQQMKYQQTSPAITQPTPSAPTPAITAEDYKFFMSLTPEQKEQYIKSHPEFQFIK